MEENKRNMAVIHLEAKENEDRIHLAVKSDGSIEIQMYAIAKFLFETEKNTGVSFSKLKYSIYLLYEKFKEQDGGRYFNE